MTLLEASLAAGVLAAIPLAYAALGELLYEKVGIFNIGIEGVMLIGAVIGFIGAVETNSALLGLIAGAAGGAIFIAVLFAIPLLLFRSSNILIGFALWFIGLGLSSQIGQSYITRELPIRMTPVKIPLLEQLPFVGRIFFRQIWPGYLAVILLVIVALWLSRTSHGLDMRSIGEDPAAAHAAGIRVAFWKVVYVTVGGALIGFGGAVLSIGISHAWRTGMTAGRGWVALALVIFAGWRPIGLMFATYLFGFLLVLGNVGQALGWAVPSEYLGMVPYLVTIIVLAIRTWREKRTPGLGPAPAALGSIFIAEERGVSSP